MTTLTLRATKTPTRQSVTVTRTEDDDGLGSAIVALALDDTITRLQVSELLADLSAAVSADFGRVSKVAQLEGTGEAFDDGATFDDGAVFADQGGTTTWAATLSNDNAHTIVRSSANELGAAHMALIMNGGHDKHRLWSYARAIERALSRLASQFTDVSDYGTGASVE